MMHRHEAVLLVRPLKQREVHHPDETERVAVDHSELASEMETQRTQRGADYFEAVRSEKEKVSLLAAHCSAECLKLLFRHELREGSLHGAVALHLHIGQPLRAVGLRHLDQPVDLLAGHIALTLHVEAADHAAGGRRVAEYAEAGVGRQIRHIDDLHAEPEIRLVRSVAVHRVLPGDLSDAVGREFIVGRLDAVDQLLIRKTELPHDIGHLSGQIRQEGGVDVHHVLLIHEGKLHVNLREFRLTVRPQILVAVAAGDLVITVEPRAHQKLLQQLRALGQRVETPRMDAAGNQIVPRAFRRRRDQSRRLDVKKAFSGEEIPDHLNHVGPEHNLTLQLRSPEIEITVGQTEILSRVDAVLHLKGRSLRG